MVRSGRCLKPEMSEKLYQRITLRFKLCLLVYQATHGLAPSYIADMVYQATHGLAPSYIADMCIPVATMSV